MKAGMGWWWGCAKGDGLLGLLSSGLLGLLRSWLMGSPVGVACACAPPLDPLLTTPVPAGSVQPQVYPTL